MYGAELHFLEKIKRFCPFKSNQQKMSPERLKKIKGKM